ncbi:hypothetical protein L873DRAFT_1819236 [Choiromyces venosus 120613-1]|uniref:Uncharacterized protein n=1 Tax=Choiromyces venosus 120613-1 TaxID=1336337 RepID=A0A3N4J4N7_9PEZI|nr:hypothetical protein L873DRAFT_1819236 [Choiromyces venosus 120613-1]
MKLLNESAAAGAGWGLVLAPGYFAAATSRGGRCVGSSIPVMIYHYPGVSNNIKLPPASSAP